MAEYYFDVSLEGRIKDLESELESSPLDVNLMLDLTSELIKLNRYDEVPSLTDRAIQIDPNNPTALSYKAWCFENIDDNLEGAIKCYNKIISLGAGNENTLINLGKLYINTKEYVKSEITTKEALKINPNIPIAYNNLIVSLMLQEKINTEQTKNEVERIIDLGLKQDQSNGNMFYYNVGSFLWKFRNDTIQAKKFLHKSIEINDEFIPSYQDLIGIYEIEKDYESEVDLLKYCLDKFGSDIDTEFHLACILSLGLRKNDEATEIYKSILERDPSNSDSWFHLGRINFNSPEISKEYLEKALEFDDGSMPAHLIKSQVEQMLNNNEDAFYHLSRAIELHESGYVLNRLAGSKDNESDFDSTLGMLETLGLKEFSVEFRDLLKKNNFKNKRLLLLEELLDKNYNEVVNRFRTEDYSIVTYSNVVEYLVNQGKLVIADEIVKISKKRGIEITDLISEINNEDAFMGVSSYADNHDYLNLIVSGLDNGKVKKYLLEGFNSGDISKILLASQVSIKILDDIKFFEKSFDISFFPDESDPALKVINGIHAMSKGEYGKAVEYLKGAGTQSTVFQQLALAYMGLEEYGLALENIDNAITRDDNSSEDLVLRAIIRQNLNFDPVECLSEFLEGASRMHNLSYSILYEDGPIFRFYNKLIDDNPNLFDIIKKVVKSDDELYEKKLNAICTLIPFMDNKRIRESFDDVLEVIVNSKEYKESLKVDHSNKSRNVLYNHIGHPLWDLGLIVKSSRNTNGRDDLYMEYITNCIIQKVMDGYGESKIVGDPIGVINDKNTSYLLIKRESKQKSMPTIKEAKKALESIAKIHKGIDESVYPSNTLEFGNMSFEIKKFNYIENFDRRFGSRCVNDENLSEFIEMYKSFIMSQETVNSDYTSKFNAFLHGDFFHGNVLEGGVIIDWERNPEGCLGNPMYDVMNYLSDIRHGEDRLNLVDYYLDQVNTGWEEEDVIFHLLHATLCWTAKKYSIVDINADCYKQISYEIMKNIGLNEMAEKFAKVQYVK